MKKQKKIKEKKVKKMIEKAYHEGFEAGQYEATSFMSKKQRKIKIEIGENLALVLLSPQFLIILLFLVMAFIIIFGKN